MNESKTKKRAYASPQREQGAEETRTNILSSARSLFARKGVDKVTIAELAREAGVAASTVYAIYKSKEGILRALMEEARFGGAFQSAREILAGIENPAHMVALTADVAAAIYENESGDLDFLHQISGFSPSLRKVEAEFDQVRSDMQEERLTRLFAAGMARPGLTLAEARLILWMYTSRDIFRMLVIDGGWTLQRYRDWLAETLVSALVAAEARPDPMP